MSPQPKRRRLYTTSSRKHDVIGHVVSTFVGAAQRRDRSHFAETYLSRRCVTLFSRKHDGIGHVASTLVGAAQRRNYSHLAQLPCLAVVSPSSAYETL